MIEHSWKISGDITFYASYQMTVTNPRIFCWVPVYSVNCSNPLISLFRILRKFIKLNGTTFSVSFHTPNGATILSHRDGKQKQYRQQTLQDDFATQDGGWQQLL